MGDTMLVRNIGDRPTRLKGYYRAVKRGEPWAVKMESIRISDPTTWFLMRIYDDITWSKNPFLEAISKNHEFMGKYIPVPITFK